MASQNPPQLLRGMKDILPTDQPHWWATFDAVRRIATNYGFDRIETPVLEATSLFVRSVGEGTDIVGKEMYSFVDKGGDNVCLRPEYTASVARTYIEHGMLNMPQPVKLWYFGPCFRHDRPQAGRYRQFWQFGFEIFGAAHPISDAQLILAGRSVFRSLGIETVVQINCLGDKAVRQQYGKALQAYFRTKKSELTEDQRLTLQKNPLRLLDSKDPKLVELLADAPQIVDHLDEASRQHFVQVLEYLDEAEVAYNLNPRLVRGLDYYTKTVFEFWAQNDESGQSALGGGGRYDTLVEQLGGQPTPSAGFAVGVERLIMKAKELSPNPLPIVRPEVFMAQLGEPARKKTLKIFEALQVRGVRLSEAMTKDGLKQQLEVANRVGAQYTLIIGQKEIMDDTVLIRDMENGIQEVVPYDRIVPEIVKRIEKNRAAGIVPVTGAVTPEKLESMPSLEEQEQPELPFDAASESDE